MTSFELNGTKVTVNGNHPHLLAALRDALPADNVDVAR